MTDLRYCYQVALMQCNESRHAQEVMRELGITYTHATPQSMGDQWWFWNCKNVPSPLPEFLSILGTAPTDAIGYGLSKEAAENIIAARDKP